jgi:formate hydrogenlyase subunit 3/multisubunit Na+/H+ antiporter MnhD subunit
MLDTEEATMSFEEKITWVNGVVTVLAASWYAWTVGGRLGQLPVTEIAYQRPLLVAVGAMIVLTIVGTIAMAIGTAIRAEITGEGSVDDIDRKDERDAHIEARGDRVAFYVSSALMVGVLALAMLERPHFWIANAVFASFVAGGLVSTGVKLAAYRRGF